MALKEAEVSPSLLSGQIYCNKRMFQRRDLSLFVAVWKAPKYALCNRECKLNRRKSNLRGIKIPLQVPLK